MVPKGEFVVTLSQWFRIEIPQSHLTNYKALENIVLVDMRATF